MGGDRGEGVTDCLPEINNNDEVLPDVGRPSPQSQIKVLSSNIQIK